MFEDIDRNIEVKIKILALAVKRNKRILSTGKENKLFG